MLQTTIILLYVNASYVVRQNFTFPWIDMTQFSIESFNYNTILCLFAKPMSILTRYNFLTPNRIVFKVQDTRSS